MGSNHERTGIWAETGGDLSKDRQLFRFGKRCAVVLGNGTATARKFDVQVARDPVFYWPATGYGQQERRAITQQTYFYANVAAGTTYTSPEFFARRGLKVKAQGALGANCSADTLVYGVEEGEITVKDIL